MSTPEILEPVDAPHAAAVRRLSEQVRTHRVFSRLATLAHVRVFMEHHVWAVWDFMSLLKSIQAALAPASTPWTPPADAETARLVNEIVLGEETDEAPDGGHASHFEIYLRAMDAAGARSVTIREFVAALQGGTSWRRALAEARAQPAARAFVRTTLELAEASLPERVAAFTLGREEIIPGMFREAVERLERSGMEAADLRLFRWYLDRHIAVDGDHHAPLAARLFRRTCLADVTTCELSLRAAARALEQRIALWDAAAVAMARR